MSGQTVQRRKIWLRVMLIATAVVWIFGSFPWVQIGSILCVQQPPLACDQPQVFGLQVLGVVVLDGILGAIAYRAVRQLRRLQHYH